VAEGTAPNGAVLTAWRLTQLESRLQDLAYEVKGFRRVLIGFAFAVACSSISFALAIRRAVGKL